MQGHHCQSFWEECDELDLCVKPQGPAELCSAPAKLSDFFLTVLQTFLEEVLICFFPAECQLSFCSHLPGLQVSNTHDQLGISPIVCN